MQREKKQQYFCVGKLSDIKQNDPFIQLFEEMILSASLSIKWIVLQEDSWFSDF